MAATDISEELRAWVRAEIDAQCFGDDFGFDIAPQAALLPQGPAAGYMITITMRSPLLGQPPILHIAAIGSPRPAHEVVVKLVSEGMEALRRVRSEALATQNGA